MSRHEDRKSKKDYSNVVDFDYTLRLMGEKTFAIESYDMFTESLPSHIEILKQSYAVGDTKKLREIAHNIKGEVAYCGAPEIKHAVELFHDTIKNHSDDKEKAETEINDLILAIENFIAVYPDFRAQQE